MLSDTRNMSLRWITAGWDSRREADAGSWGLEASCSAVGCIENIDRNKGESRREREIKRERQSEEREEEGAEGRGKTTHRHNLFQPFLFSFFFQCLSATCARRRGWVVINRVSAGREY